tara:strand:+ start:4049 stop:4216 length:168 start_codon:yes stop_codon:yes gene_type:complete
MTERAVLRCRAEVNDVVMGGCDGVYILPSGIAVIETEFVKRKHEVYGRYVLLVEL